MVSPSELRSLADGLRGGLRETAADAGMLRSFGSTFDDWMSPAAEHFNSHQYEGSFAQFDMVERDYTDVANILDDLADQLQAKLDQIRRVSGNVRAFFSNPPVWAQGTDTDPNPIWVRQNWRYRPYNMPGTDDPRWLTVGNHFRNVYGITV